MKNIKVFISTLRAKEALRSPEERKKAFTFFFLLFILFAAAAFSIRNFITLNAARPRHLPFRSADGGKRTKDVEIAAEELNMKLSAFRKLLKNTPQLAELAGAAERSPVSVITPPPATAEETRVPEFPPEVKIKSLVVLGDSRACTLEIDGEEADRIFEQGMTFGGGKGRIVSIDAKGVKWKWVNKSYRADL